MGGGSLNTPSFHSPGLGMKDTVLFGHLWLTIHSKTQGLKDHNRHSLLLTSLWTDRGQPVVSPGLEHPGLHSISLAFWWGWLESWNFWVPNLTALHGSWILKAHIPQRQRVEASSPAKATHSTSLAALPPHSPGRGNTPQNPPLGRGEAAPATTPSSVFTLRRAYRGAWVLTRKQKSGF